MAAAQRSGGAAQRDGGSGGGVSGALGQSEIGVHFPGEEEREEEAETERARARNHRVAAAAPPRLLYRRRST